MSEPVPSSSRELVPLIPISVETGSEIAIPIPLEKEESLWEKFKTHCTQSFAPIERWAQIVFRDIKEAFAELSASPKSLSQWGITALRFIKGLITVPVLFGAALTHTVTHLFGLAQLALKVDKLFSDAIRGLVDRKVIDYRSGAWYALNALRAVTTFAPAFFLNFDQVGRMAVFTSGVHHWDVKGINAPGNKEALNSTFTEWREKDTNHSSGISIKIPFGEKDGVTQNLDGYLLEPKNLPSKGIVILQHGQQDCYQKKTDAASNYLEKGYTVLMYNRRGCLDSDGIPTEKNSVDDCERVVQFAQKHLQEKGVEPSECNQSIVIHGHSLGGLIAANASDRPTLDGVRIILDRTGVNLRSVGYHFTGGITSFGTDLLHITSGIEFENSKKIDRLQQENRLIVIKSAKDLDTPLSVKDRVFGSGEVAAQDKFLTRIEEIENRALEIDLELKLKKAELKKELDVWKKRCVDITWNDKQFKKTKVYQECISQVTNAAFKAKTLKEFASKINPANPDSVMSILNEKLRACKSTDINDQLEYLADILNEMDETYDATFFDELSKQHFQFLLKGVTTENITAQKTLNMLEGYGDLTNRYNEINKLQADLNGLNMRVGLGLQTQDASKVIVNRGESVDAHDADLSSDVYDAIDEVLSHGKPSPARPASDENDLTEETKAVAARLERNLQSIRANFRDDINKILQRRDSIPPPPPPLDDSL